MATDENISNASYVGRTVEITPDSKKAVENENSEFDLKMIQGRKTFLTQKTMLMRML